MSQAARVGLLLTNGILYSGDVCYLYGAEMVLPFLTKLVSVSAGVTAISNIRAENRSGTVYLEA